MHDGWDSWLTSSLVQLQNRSLFRVLRPTVPSTSPVEVSIPATQLNAWLAGELLPPPTSQLSSLTAQDEQLRPIKLFSLNDYLGLSTHPEVCKAAADAALACGNGPRSSALVGGYTSWHRDLETALARLKGAEECLLFPTGFAANLAVVSSLCVDGNVAVFSDELNHASIVDGARLGRRHGTRLSVYRHNDLHHLEELLAATPSGMRRLVITDTLFSMDGDFADLQGLVDLKRKHDFLLAIDDAHGTLVCGDNGGGAAEMLGVDQGIDLHVGTLSKAFGCMGGFVACSARWKDFLVNRGRSQVYSTALPVPVVAAAHAALRVAAQEPWRRRHLWRLTGQLGSSLGIRTHSPIVPLVLGSEQATLSASSQLLARGFHVPAIRPPTVPQGTSRLRVSLSAGHSSADVELLVAALQDCGVQCLPLDRLGRVLGTAGAAAGAAGAASSMERAADVISMSGWRAQQGWHGGVVGTQQAGRQQLPGLLEGGEAAEAGGAAVQLMECTAARARL